MAGSVICGRTLGWPRGAARAVSVAFLGGCWPRWRCEWPGSTRRADVHRRGRRTAGLVAQHVVDLCTRVLAAFASTGVPSTSQVAIGVGALQLGPPRFLSMHEPRADGPHRRAEPFTPRLAAGTSLRQADRFAEAERADMDAGSAHWLRVSFRDRARVWVHAGRSASALTRNVHRLATRRAGGTDLPIVGQPDRGGPMINAEKLLWSASISALIKHPGGVGPDYRFWPPLGRAGLVHGPQRVPAGERQ
jgi:hypothetical protein